MEYRTLSGAVVFVQVSTEDSTGTDLAGPGDLVEKAAVVFEDALSTVRTVAESLVGTVETLSNGPQAVEIEFGLSLAAGANAFIASADAGATFKVTLKWSLGNSQ